MTWIIFGILSPFLWAVANNFDQLLLRQYFPDNVRIYRAISMCSRLLMLPFIFILEQVLLVPLWLILILMLTGVGGFLAFLCYNKALQYAEVMQVAPFLQTIPVFMLIFLYFTLGETLSVIQTIACGIIIVSAICLMVDFKSKMIIPVVMGLMLLTSLIFATGNTIQRIFLVDDVVWYAVFLWMQMGSGLIGLLIFIRSKQARNRLKQIVIEKEVRLASFIFLQQLFMNGAFFCFVISLAQAPAGAMAQVLGGFQPAFVLVVGFLFYKLFPNYFDPPKTKHEWVWIIFFMTLMMIGVFMIYDYEAINQ